MHPDRVGDEDKKLATEKFQMIVLLYSVLSSKKKRALYDENGIIDGDDNNDSLPPATFQVTSEHIQGCKEKFKGTNSHSHTQLKSLELSYST